MGNYFTNICIKKNDKISNQRTYTGIYAFLTKYGVSEEKAVECAIWSETAGEDEIFDDELFLAKVYTKL